jgi:hypothetical protein
MKTYKHRKKKGQLYSDRKICLDFISNAIATKSPVNEPYKLSYHSSKNCRKRARKKYLSVQMTREML